MKHFLRIAALLALFAFPSAAEATGKFLVLCTTSCTWDNTNDAIWSTLSGGTNNTTHPVSTDTVTIDQNSCVGGVTCTITTGAVTISVQSIAWGACTASTTGCIIDASANNTNFTINSAAGTSFSGTGTGTRKWLAGTGTYALTMTAANLCFSMANTSGDQGSVFSGATWTCSGSTTSGRSWDGGGFSFGATTFNANSSGGSLTIVGANTFASLTVGAPNYVLVGGTTTITGALLFTGGSSSALTYFASNSMDTPRTISIGSASSGTWAAIRAITTSGAAAFLGTSCFDLLRNTFANSGSCLPPSAGGGGGGRIIGG